MHRIPAVPYFKPGMNAAKALVLENLVTLDSKDKNQGLGRQYPTDYEPIPCREKSDSASQSLLDCQSWTFGLAHRETNLRLFHPLLRSLIIVPRLK